MREPRYLIDGEPASAMDLIDKARAIEPDAGKSGLFFTSAAAKILRDNGHTVGDNPDWQAKGGSDGSA